MKKILSLTLVAVMLLTTLMLSSCEFMDTVMDFVNDIMGKEEEVRTTITEEEWLNTLEITNFTITMEAAGADVLMAFDDSLIEYNVSQGKEGYHIFMDLEKGVIVAEEESKWIGVKTEVTDEKSITLGTLGLLEDINYADLVYEEANKTYIAKSTSTIFSFTFENGVLVSAELLPVDVEEDGIGYITAIGTTVVEIPEYEMWTYSPKE